jgi:hypothetical protein
MAKKIKIGDVVEIPTAEGLAYAQYTQKDSLMGNLIRVKEGLFASRPDSLKEVLDRKNQIITFVPLQAMVNRNIVSIVSNEQIPPADSSLPIFRNGIRNPADSTIKWWFWDGQKEWLVGYNLTEEEKKYPLLGTWNDTLLKERIISGWSHTTAEYF